MVGFTSTGQHQPQCNIFILHWLRFCTSSSCYAAILTPYLIDSKTLESLLKFSYSLTYRQIEYGNKHHFNVRQFKSNWWWPSKQTKQVNYYLHSYNCSYITYKFDGSFHLTTAIYKKKIILFNMHLKHWLWCCHVTVWLRAWAKHKDIIVLVCPNWFQHLSNIRRAARGLDLSTYSRSQNNVNMA